MSVPGRGPLRAFARLPWPLATALISIAIVAPTALGADSSTRVPPAAAARAARFWTPVRMARARPPAAHLGGGKGAAAPPRRGRPLEVAPLAAPSATPGASFQPVADPTAPAYRVNGVVFFEDFFGLGRCSGTAVNAPNLSVVVTAGHCVNSGGGRGRWYDHQWVFVPAYRHGQRPFGAFPAKWLGTTPRWHSEFAENADVGIAVVGRNARGQRLGAAVGGAGFAAGLKPRQDFEVHGYPAEEPFDGETQQVCAGTTFLGRDPQSLLSGGPLSLAVTCNVTGGASGGGWTIAGGRLNSVTAYDYPSSPTTVFGPYFGKEVARLYHRAGGVR
jgi:V8-like Glu-specific endopeptidase